MRVDSRGRQVYVSKQLLNGSDVGPPVHQMGGKGMSQDVRRHLPDSRNLFHVPLTHIVYGLCSESEAPLTEKENLDSSIAAC